MNLIIDRELDTIGYIYKITSPNNKIYIGQTLNIHNRKSYYRSFNFKQQIKLWNNCQKYNWNPLDTFEIIEECKCGNKKSNLNDREIYWISFYDSFNNGLNCNGGGNGNLGYIPSNETREKMRASKVGIKHSEDRNRQKSEYTKGRKHTDDAKEKMSTVKRQNMNDDIKERIRKGLMGNKNGIGNSGNPKKVYCLNNNKIYSSIKEASIELELSITGIINVCKNRCDAVKGYKFKYYEEEFSITNGSGN